MARTGRPGLSHEQKAELWRRWKAGETLSDIGRALGKHAASVFGVVAAKGGFAPVPRSRKPGSLSLVEREEISRGLVAGRSFRQLGRHLGRAPSTISREVARNGGRRAYRAARADERASDHARRPKPCQLAFNSALCKLVAESCRSQWSPQQIAGWLKAQYPGDRFMSVSHETIYQEPVHSGPRRSQEGADWLICAAAGSCAGAERPQPRARRGADHRCRIDPRPSGRDRGSRRARPLGRRPAEWCQNSHIATLVERSSRFVMLVKVTARTAKAWSAP